MWDDPFIGISLLVAFVCAAFSSQYDQLLSLCYSVTIFFFQFHVCISDLGSTLIPRDHYVPVPKQCQEREWLISTPIANKTFSNPSQSKLNETNVFIFTSDIRDPLRVWYMFYLFTVYLHASCYNSPTAVYHTLKEQ